MTAANDPGSGVGLHGLLERRHAGADDVDPRGSDCRVDAGCDSGNPDRVRLVQGRSGQPDADASTRSDSILLDTTPPSGTITAAPSPTSGTVTISCNATDAVYMQFSNNGSAWSTWEAYGTSKAGWNLISGAGGSATNGTRTIYAKFSDGAGGTADLGNKTTTSTTVVLDTTGPTVTAFSINSGAAWTNVGTVSLALTGSDANYASSTFQMRFSNNGSSWSAWEAYGATKSGWDMTSSTYGGSTANTSAKYVYVQLKDPLGNLGAGAYDTIGYDTVLPTIASVSLNSAAAYTNGATVTITLSASDATSGVSQMRFSNNASSWSAWEAYATTRSGWNMTSSTYGGTSSNGYKYVYVQVRDVVGNISSYSYDYIIYDTAAPSGPSP